MTTHTKRRAQQINEIGEEAERLMGALEDARTKSRSQLKLGRQEIHRRTAILTQTCSILKLSPPLSLSALVARCLDVPADLYVLKDRAIPAKPENYAAWDRAVRCEAHHNPHFGSPPTAPLNAVAKAAFCEESGSSSHRRTIMEWRKSSIYKFHVDLVRTPLGRNLFPDNLAGAGLSERPKPQR